MKKSIFVFMLITFLHTPLSFGANVFEASNHYNRGLALAGSGKYGQAISEYSKAIVIIPNFAEAYDSRRLAHHNKGLFNQAIIDFTKAIEITPAFAEAYSNRGLSYHGKGLLDKAISDQTKAIEINPKLAGAYINRGISYAKKRQHDLAIRDFTQPLRSIQNLLMLMETEGLLLMQSASLIELLVI